MNTSTCRPTRCATALSRASSRPASSNDVPRWANWSAKIAPSPELAPVMTANDMITPYFATVFTAGWMPRAWLTRPIPAPRMGHIGQKYVASVVAATAAHTVSTMTVIAR